MKWPGREVRRQRDTALVRAAQLEARLAEAAERQQALERELARERQALERVVDNALFAAGASPVFRPEDARFRPRAVEQQRADAAAAQAPLTAAEWRRKVEALDREAAERDRRGRLAEELKVLAQEAKEARHGKE